MSKQKRLLVEEKIRRNLEPTITKTDVIPLVNRCWAASFARTENNKKAIADRGWGPLNFAQLANPEIIATKPKGENNDDDDNINFGSNQPLTLEQLNTGEAPVLKQFDRFLQRQEVVEKSEKRRREAYEGGREQEQQVNKTKRMTAGVAFHQSVQLNRPELTTLVLEKHAEKEEKEESSRKRAQVRTAKLHQRIHAAKETPEEEWSLEDYGAMLQFYKQKGDEKMANNINERRQQYESRKLTRAEPIIMAETQIYEILGGGETGDDVTIL